MFQTQRETSRALHSLKEATDGDCPHWKAFLFMGRMFESRFEWSNAADSYAKAVRASIVPPEEFVLLCPRTADGMLYFLRTTPPLLLEPHTITCCAPLGVVLCWCALHVALEQVHRFVPSVCVVHKLGDCLVASRDIVGGIEVLTDLIDHVTKNHPDVRRECCFVHTHAPTTLHVCPAWFTCTVVRAVLPLFSPPRLQIVGITRELIDMLPKKPQEGAAAAAALPAPLLTARRSFVRGSSTAGVCVRGRKRV
jgi:hypothetical protein